jgi:serine/threonine protein kinase/tetratricopeptide (TPR) repeat protein
MHSPKWDGQDWEFVDQALRRLEESWGTKRDAKLSEFVPDASHRCRQLTLVELIKVDQEHRWKSGQKKRLEEYLEEWPELADKDDIKTELLESECMTRAILDDLLEREELQERFSALCDQIDLERINAEADIERGVRSEVGQRMQSDALEETCDDEPSERNSASALPVGQKFGRYKILSGPLKGGMGLVYQAYDTNLRRNVALKIPQVDLAAQAEGRARFFDEARAAAKVRHLNVCQVYDSGEIGDTPYITMAWIEGLPLDAYIKLQGITPRDAAKLVQTLASALFACHKKDVIHRDIKPSNVMIDHSDGSLEPFLMDFGLARLKRDDNQPTSTGSFVGTLPYMSPEQAGRRGVDKRTDLYSLGVLFYELLTGSLPFSGTKKEILRSIRDAEPPKPRDCCPELDETLEAICLKAMAKKVGDRFQSANALASAIEEYFEGTPRNEGRDRLPVGLTRNHLPQKWVHATTEDEQYVEPSQALGKLNELAAKSEIRVLTVTGVGGCGKTALVAHWLRNANSSFPRNIKGIFYWSFSADDSIASFLDSLLSFAEDELDYPCDPGSDHLKAVLELLNTEPLIVVLDGFEECQEGAKPIGHIIGEWKSSRPELHSFADLSGNGLSGRIRESYMLDLLEAICDCQQESLIIITSRYPILGLPSSTAARVGSLDADDIWLNEKEGVELLGMCGAKIHAPETPTEVFRRWGGHPLGLRVFAAATKRPVGDEQSLLFPDSPFGPGYSDNELVIKLGGIAEFYYDHLPETQVEILKIISLFSIPTTDAVIKQLAGELPVFQKAVGDLSNEELRLVLCSLCEAGLIRRTKDDTGDCAYLCHPILREHFCLRVRQEGFGAQSQSLLRESQFPNRGTYLTVQHVAIQALLESDDFRQADNIMRNALDGGRLFQEAGELEVGKMCVCEFVRDMERQEKCKAQLSKQRLVYYLRMAELFMLLLGQPDEARRYGDEALRHGTSDGSLEVLLNHSLIWSLTGFPDKGEESAQTALELAKVTGNRNGEQHSLTCRAFSRYLQGRTSHAEKDFEQAEQVGTDSKSSCETLNGADAILQAHYLLRVDQLSKARELVERELRLVDDDDSPDVGVESRPRCQWLLGLIETVEENHLRAIEYLSEAERVVTKHHSLLLLPFILQAKADVYRRMKKWDEAEKYCGEALYLSASRTLELVHTESLILRGRICLERTIDENGFKDSVQTDADWGDAEWEFGFVRAMADADDALLKAREHKYRWLRYEAMLLLADGEEAESQHHKKAASRHRDEAKTLFEENLQPKS